MIFFLALLLKYIVHRKPKVKKKSHDNIKQAKKYMKKRIKEKKKKGFKPAPAETTAKAAKERVAGKNADKNKEDSEDKGKQEGKQTHSETKKEQQLAADTTVKETTTAAFSVQGHAVVLFFCAASVWDRQAARLRPEALRLWFDRTAAKQQPESGENDQSKGDEKGTGTTETKEIVSNDGAESKIEGNENDSDSKIESKTEGKHNDSDADNERKIDVHDQNKTTTENQVETKADNNVSEVEGENCRSLLNADAYEHHWAEVSPASTETVQDDPHLRNLIKLQRQAIERVWLRVSGEGVHHAFECLRSTYTRIMHRLNSQHSRTMNSRFGQNLRGDVALMLPVSDCLHHCGVNLRLLGKVRHRFLKLQASVVHKKRTMTFIPKSRSKHGDKSDANTVTHKEQPIQTSDFFLQDFTVPQPTSSTDPDVVASTQKTADKSADEIVPGESNSNVSQARNQFRSVIAALKTSGPLGIPPTTVMPEGTNLFTTSDRMVCNQCLLADMVARVLRGRVCILLRKHYAVSVPVTKDRLGQRSDAHAAVWELLRDFFGSGPLLSDAVGAGGRGSAVDWKCTICGRANPHRRQACRVCGTAMPETASDVTAATKALEKRSCELWSVNIKVWLLDKFGPWALSTNETGEW